ncbi:MAG: glycosyltransferase family 2 protein [Pseudohaliea sp.]
MTLTGGEGERQESTLREAREVMEVPKVSVVLCTYNGERYLGEQLGSILGQTTLPAEVIVYDDCSSDGTIRLAEGLAEETAVPVRILSGSENLGAGRAFSVALAAASGDLIVLADQDDRWQADRLEQLVRAASALPAMRPRLFVSSLVLTNEAGDSLRARHPGLERALECRDLSWRDLAFGNLIPGCAMAFDRSLLERLLPVPGEAVLHDWWIALCASCLGEIHFLDGGTIYYRVHGNNNQGVPGWRRTLAEVFSTGPREIAIRNFVAAFRQLEALKARMDELGESETSEALACLCELPLLTPWQRFRRLRDLRIARRSRLHTMISYAASMAMPAQRRGSLRSGSGD